MGENGAVAMLASDDVEHLFNHIGMCFRHVVVFVQVGRKVVETRLAACHHHFPVAHSEAELPRFGKFPIEKFVLRLPFLAQQSGRKGDAVEDVLGVVGIFFVEVFLHPSARRMWASRRRKPADGRSLCPP